MTPAERGILRHLNHRATACTRSEYIWPDSKIPKYAFNMDILVNSLEAMKLAATEGITSMYVSAFCRANHLKG